MRKVLTTLSLKVKHTKRMDGHETIGMNTRSQARIKQIYNVSIRR